MFTPDNFYFILREHYAQWPDRVMMIPKENGQKHFHDFVPYLTGHQATDYLSRDLYSRSKSTNLWLYDQEPLFASASETYRWNLQQFLDPSLNWLIDEIDFATMHAIWHPTSRFPIWCHSEFNSQEIRHMEDLHVIPCFYWYHAFVSRDWFRHWHHSKVLQTRDISACNYRFLLYARAFSGSREYRTKIINSLSDLPQQTFQPRHDEANITSDYSAKIDIEHSQMCAIHLVAETLFDVDKIYLTEKIFKPIVMNQPFIIWAAPGSLAFLKRYGFETFDSCWSEAYDLEQDHGKRMAMLIELVRSLHALPKDQFLSIVQRGQSIAEHNRRVFFSDKFMQICWKELQDSFEQSFVQQQELENRWPWGQTCQVIGTNPNLLLIPFRRAMIKRFLQKMDQDTRQQLLRCHTCFADL